MLTHLNIDRINDVLWIKDNFVWLCNEDKKIILSIYPSLLIGDIKPLLATTLATYISIYLGNAL